MGEGWMWACAGISVAAGLWLAWLDTAAETAAKYAVGSAYDNDETQGCTQQPALPELPELPELPAPLIPQVNPTTGLPMLSPGDAWGVDVAGHPWGTSS
jgi:hypothetical protein